MRYKKIAVVASAFLLTCRVLALSGAAEDAVCFVLREYNGKIALFGEECGEPLAVYSLPPEGLFPADMELLREGIRLKSRAEVARLIEDLGVE